MLTRQDARTKYYLLIASCGLTLAEAKINGGV